MSPARSPWTLGKSCCYVACPREGVILVQPACGVLSLFGVRQWLVKSGELQVRRLCIQECAQQKVLSLQQVCSAPEASGDRYDASKLAEWYEVAVQAWKNLFRFCILVFLCLRPRACPRMCASWCKDPAQSNLVPGVENIGGIKHVIRIVNLCTTNLVWKALFSQPGLSVYPLFEVSHRSCDKYGPGRSMVCALQGQELPVFGQLFTACFLANPGQPWTTLSPDCKSIEVSLPGEKGCSARGSCCWSMAFPFVAPAALPSTLPGCTLARVTSSK